MVALLHTSAVPRTAGRGNGLGLHPEALEFWRRAFDARAYDDLELRWEYTTCSLLLPDEAVLWTWYEDKGATNQDLFEPDGDETSDVFGVSLDPSGASA